MSAMSGRPDPVGAKGAKGTSDPLLLAAESQDALRLNAAVAERYLTARDGVHRPGRCSAPPGGRCRACPGAGTIPAVQLLIICISLNPAVGAHPAGALPT
jgi:hypothetical protein